MTKLRSDLILLLAAIIWGFAFVAQRIGMEYLGPFTFNGIRFTLGILVLLPFILSKKRKLFTSETVNRKIIWMGSVATGFILFGGVALQQLGLQSTTAGKAGFITGLYVIFVPIVGIFLGQKIRMTIWAGVILSATGLYLLSVTSGFSMALGDFLVLLCAIFFTGHVLMIGWLSPMMDSYKLAAIQFAICAFLNLVFAVFLEKIEFQSILAAAVPLLYGGLLSVGVAYTLQVVAQKHAHPAYASIILSLEAVFAAIGGWLILEEYLTNRALLGCFLMLCGMIIVQVRQVRK